MKKLLSFCTIIILLLFLGVLLIPHIALILLKGASEEIFDFLLKWIHELQEGLK